MTEAQKAALRRKIGQLEEEISVLMHYINIWPGADVSRERTNAESLALLGQNNKVSRVHIGITNDILDMVKGSVGVDPHPNCTVCDGNGWFWGGERGERQEECDCYDAYLTEKLGD